MLKKIPRSLNRWAIALLLFLPVQLLQAETIIVPIKIDFPLLHQLIVTQLFKGNSASAELLHDPSGCSKIVLSNPHLSEFKRHLKINARLTAKLAVKMLGKCTLLLNWDGYAQIISDPVIKKNSPQQIYLQIIDSHLISLENKMLTSGALWEQAKKHFHPLLNRFQLDLAPTINELKTLLPLFMPHHTHAQVNDMLTSLRIADMQITADGIQSNLAFKVETIDQKNFPEHALTEKEQAQWQEKWQSMDALLTHTIKLYAGATELQELRLALFDILLDARYQLQEALQQDQSDDPVRHWFINSWSQLIPVLKQISIKNPKYASLSLMTLITASDALQTLDKLGPTFGLDISIDGLRRLARMLNDTQVSDPLKYDEALDPELFRLFQFNLISTEKKYSNINLWPISSAFAANSRPLNRWIPDRQGLNDYLLNIRKLLLKTVRQTAIKSDLTSAQQDVFKKLVMATAWQESCWRQYIVKKNKIVPLRSSTGDTGIMQVNEKVWRGFVDRHKLRWDIEYNVQTGSNILLNYLTRYAIKKAEHKQRGGIDNLARATYSAYNGGPAQVSRYRTGRQYIKVDQAFYQKYLAVKQGNELKVAECLGQKSGRIPTPPSKGFIAIESAKPQKTTDTKKKLIHYEKWINQQPKKYFTQQIGVFSSKKAAINFIQQQSIPGNYAVYQQQKNRRSHYLVIYGHYSTRQRAKKESARFKLIKPWIRSFKDLIWNEKKQ